MGPTVAAGWSYRYRGDRSRGARLHGTVRSRPLGSAGSYRSVKRAFRLVRPRVLYITALLSGVLYWQATFTEWYSAAVQTDTGCYITAPLSPVAIAPRHCHGVLYCRVDVAGPGQGVSRASAAGP